MRMHKDTVSAAQAMYNNFSICAIMKMCQILEL